MATVTSRARFAINPRFTEPLEVVKAEASEEPDKLRVITGKPAEDVYHPFQWKPFYWLYAAVGVIVLYWLLKKR